MKKQNLFIIIIFIAFLTLPSITYVFVKDKMDNANYENRNLYTKPTFNIKTIFEYPKAYDNYYNDHLPFKNEIRKLKSKILYTFNVSATPRVIIAKDKWLFYNSEAANDGETIENYTKTSKYSKKDKKNIKKELELTNNKLKSNNVDFYLLVIPNKENVYSDKLEGIINRSKNKYSKTEDLINYLKKETNLNIIYPKEILLKNRKKYETYGKLGTHWNNYGAYLAFNNLMKNINNTYTPKPIKIAFKKDENGIAKMNLLNDLTHKEATVTNFYNNIKTNCTINKYYAECESSNPIYNKNILIVGDSFREKLIPYISKLYKNSTFIHRDFYKQEYIKEKNIDIVIFITVERYSECLKNIPL